MISTIITYLSLAYSFDLAYEKTNWMMFDYDEDYEWHTNNTNYFGFKPEVEFRAGTDRLYGFIGGGSYVSARINGLKPGKCDPVVSDFEFKVGISYGSVEAGFDYNCCHPIKTYATDDRALDWQTEGSYSKFYIKVSGTIGGKKK